MIMGFSWTENISVGTEIESVDVQEIRDNVDTVKDTSCPSDDTTVYATNDSMIDTTDYGTHNDPHLGTFYDGDDSVFDSVDYSGVLDPHYFIDNASAYTPVNDVADSVDDSADYETVFGQYLGQQGGCIQY